MQYIGDNEIVGKYLGDTEVQKQYLGDNLMWQKEQPIDYTKIPLTFEILEDGDIRWMHTSASSSKTIQYSKDNGATWTSVTSSRGSEGQPVTGGTLIHVNAGDKVMFKGSYDAYGGSNYYAAFEETHVKCNLMGNLTSMIYGDNFTGQTTMNNTGQRNFRNFFGSMYGVVSMEHLVLPTNLTQGCFSWAMQFCTGLTTAPVLSATTLVSECYKTMLRGCTNLNHVTCLATNPNTGYTSNWLSGVSETGIFVKASGVNWPISISGIPST